MLGYISYGDGPKRPVFERRQLLGNTFAALRMAENSRPEGLLPKRRAAVAARKLRELGVRQAVFPVDFPYLALFARQGVCPVDPLPLRQALAAPLVQRRLSAMGISGTQATIAVSGRHMSRALMDAAKALAIHYRYVMLDVPTGAEEFARTLRREYGISLLLRPAVEQLDRADALLLYGPRGDLSGENPILCTLYPGGERGWEELSYGLPAALAESIEPNCCREQLMAALYAAGVLPLENILAEIEVDRTGKYLYNANAIIIK